MKTFSKHNYKTTYNDCTLVIYITVLTNPKRKSKTPFPFYIYIYENLHNLKHYSSGYRAHFRQLFIIKLISRKPSLEYIHYHMTISSSTHNFLENKQFPQQWTISWRNSQLWYLTGIAVIICWQCHKFTFALSG